MQAEGLAPRYVLENAGLASRDFLLERYSDLINYIPTPLFLQTSLTLSSNP